MRYVCYALKDKRCVTKVQGMDDNKKGLINPKQKKHLSIAVAVAIVLMILLLLELTGVFDAFIVLLTALESVLFGLFFACIQSPLQKRFEKFFFEKLKDKKKNPENKARNISVALSVVILIAILVTLVVLVIPQLTETLTTIMPELSSLVKSFNERVKNYSDSAFWQERVYPVIEDFTNNISSWILSNFGIGTKNFASISSGISSMLNTVLNAVVGIIMSIYLLMEKKLLFAHINKLNHAIFGKQKGTFVMDIINDGARIFADFFGAKIIEAFINGVLCFVLMIILQLPYATLISVIVGVSNIIPFFGPWIGVILGTAFTILVSPSQAIIFVIMALVIMAVDSYAIGPHLLAKSTGISAFWVIVSIMVFGYLMGIVGMLVGVPLFAWIYCIVKKLTDNSLAKKGLATDTKEYEVVNTPEDDDFAEEKLLKKVEEKKAEIKEKIAGTKAEKEDTDEHK